MFVVFFAALGNYMAVLFVPAPLSLLFTFFYEPVLLKHIPREMAEGVDNWYFEGVYEREKKRKNDDHRTGLLQRLNRK